LSKLENQPRKKWVFFRVRNTTAVILFKNIKWNATMWKYRTCDGSEKRIRRNRKLDCRKSPIVRPCTNRSNQDWRTVQPYPINYNEKFFRSSGSLSLIGRWNQKHYFKCYWLWLHFSMYLRNGSLEAWSRLPIEVLCVWVVGTSIPSSLACRRGVGWTAALFFSNVHVSCMSNFLSDDVTFPPPDLVVLANMCDVEWVVQLFCTAVSHLASLQFESHTRATTTPSDKQTSIFLLASSWNASCHCVVRSVSSKLWPPVEQGENPHQQKQEPLLDMFPLITLKDAHHMWLTFCRREILTLKVGELCFTMLAMVRKLLLMWMK
jgi:hypothetical protein